MRPGSPYPRTRPVSSSPDQSTAARHSVDAPSTAGFDMPIISAPLTSSAFRPRLAPALRRRRSETSQMSSKAAPRRSTILHRKGNHGSTRELTVRVNALRNFDYPEAILFDCDGVLCETERDGHRVTFNMTFKENGLDHDWDVDLYGELLKIGGGNCLLYTSDAADE